MRRPSGVLAVGDVNGFHGQLTVLNTSGDGHAEVYATGSRNRSRVTYRFPGSASGANTRRTVVITRPDLVPDSTLPLTGVAAALVR